MVLRVDYWVGYILIISCRALCIYYQSCCCLVTWNNIDNEPVTLHSAEDWFDSFVRRLGRGNKEMRASRVGTSVYLIDPFPSSRVCLLCFVWCFFFNFFGIAAGTSAEEREPATKTMLILFLFLSYSYVHNSPINDSSRYGDYHENEIRRQTL